MPAKPCEDNLGNKFASHKDLCKFYNIQRNTFYRKLNEGYTIPEIIETYNPKNEECIDHLGKKFKNKIEMCKYHKIDYDVFEARVNQLKWPIKKALTKPIQKPTYIDHLNNIFTSLEEMCQYHNVNKHTYITRRKRGRSIKESLTGIFKKKPSNYKIVEDHLGNKFKTIKDLCNKYNITRSIYDIRYKKYGWTLEEALTIPKNLYIGEYRVAECLKSLNIKFYHDVTIKTIFEDLNINIDWSEFLSQLRSNLATAGYKWSEKKILKLRPDFTLYTDDDNKILGVIEFDGEQHQNFVEYFFKTIENFFKRNNADFAKQSLWEYMNLPMLRIRHDQIDNIEYMVKDFIANPENYIHNHNTYLSEEEYWSILTEQKEKLNLAFA